MTKPLTTKRQIKLTYESLIALLQGKTVGLVSLLPNGDQVEIEIKPPFEGAFLTFEEIERIRFDSQMDIMDILAKLRETHWQADD